MERNLWMQIKGLLSFKYLRHLWTIDENEHFFINNSPALSNTNDTGEVTLIQIPPDNYYVALFYLAGKYFRNAFNAKLIGLWSINVVVLPENNNPWILQILFLLKNKIIKKRWEKKWVKIYSAVGTKKTTNLNQLSIFARLNNLFYAYKIWESIKSKKELLDLAIDGLPVGDLIYDTYLRFRVTPTVNLKDWYLVYLIAKTLDAQQSIKSFLSKRNVKFFLTSYIGYIHYGIAARQAFLSGVTVYSGGNTEQYFKKMTSIKDTHVSNHEAYSSDFENQKDKKLLLQYAKENLLIRFSGKKDRATQYMKESAFLENGVSDLLLDRCDGVVFLHDFLDAPHVYRWMLFEDFWEWIQFTIQTIIKEGLNFCIKPHPSQTEESKKIVELLKRQYPEINWLSPKVSNKAIFNSNIKCGVSVYGTILHELAYHGISAIAAGDHPHISFDFCHTAETIEEYRSLLTNYRNLELPEDCKEQVLKFYYMHNLSDKEELSIIDNALNLRELAPNDSKSLVTFLKRLNNKSEPLPVNSLI